MSKEKQQTTMAHKIMTIIGTVLCVILIPVLIINCTLIIKSYVNTDEVPSIAGYCPLIVLTDSMYPYIHAGDLIICKSGVPEEIETGDVIAFFDPAGNGSSIVTHRVEEVVTEDGAISFVTKGDANNTADKLPVPADKLVGVYQMRIPGAGNIAMFMQTTTGLIVCVGLPLVLLIVWDVLRRRKYDSAKKKDTDALLAELEALKAEKAAKEAEAQEEPAEVK